MTKFAFLVHIRRNFFKLHQDHGSPIAAEALRRIGLLYAIEREGHELTVLARLQSRQQYAKPVLAELHDWLLATRKTVAIGGKIGSAIEHAVKRRPALLRYADSGSSPIDNNPAGNAVRPIVLGKKNWFFAGSERAGRRAAAIQSLPDTAKPYGPALTMPPPCGTKT